MHMPGVGGHCPPPCDSVVGGCVDGDGVNCPSSQDSCVLFSCDLVRLNTRPPCVSTRYDCGCVWWFSTLAGIHFFPFCTRAFSPGSRVEGMALPALL